MKRMSVLLAATAISASSATAADLRRAPAPAPAVPYINPAYDAYLEVGGGYAWSSLDGGPTSIDADGGRARVRGTFAANLTEMFVFQFDAAFERAWNTLEGAGPTDVDMTGTQSIFAAHAAWRNSAAGAFGLLGQYTADKTKFEFGPSSFTTDADHWFLGVEGQYFLGGVTLYGQVAYHGVDSSLSTASLDGDGIIAAGQLRFFATPDWMLALKGSYDTINYDAPTGGFDQDTWSVALRTEYRMTDMPLSLFAELAYTDIKYDFGGTGPSNIDQDETKVMVGFKYNFGSRSLLERDRTGASFDPLEVRSVNIGTFGTP